MKKMMHNVQELLTNTSYLDKIVHVTLNQADKDKW